MAGLQNLTVAWAGESDCAYLDSLLNDPATQRQQGYSGSYTCRPCLNTPDNFLALVARQEAQPVGAWFFLWKLDCWEVHTFLSLRGKDALRASRLGLDLFWTRTGAKRLTSYCPRSIPAALAYAVAMGAKITRSDAQNIHVELCQPSR
jgi:hypothetical protein